MVIDLVRDVSPQLHPEKLDRDHILIDSADEILANKLTALVGSSRSKSMDQRRWNDQLEAAVVEFVNALAQA